MATAKISTTLDRERVAEAKRRVGERAFSRYLDDALALKLQHDRLADLEQELSETHGPIPVDVQRRIDEVPWPR